MPGRRLLTAPQRAVLERWLAAASASPYPSELDKRSLAAEAGIDVRRWQPRREGEKRRPLRSRRPRRTPRSLPSRAQANQVSRWFRNVRSRRGGASRGDGDGDGDDRDEGVTSEGDSSDAPAPPGARAPPAARARRVSARAHNGGAGGGGGESSAGESGGGAESSSSVNVGSGGGDGGMHSRMGGGGGGGGGGVVGPAPAWERSRIEGAGEAGVRGACGRPVVCLRAIAKPRARNAPGGDGAAGTGNAGRGAAVVAEGALHRISPWFGGGGGGGCGGGGGGGGTALGPGVRAGAFDAGLWDAAGAGGLPQGPRGAPGGAHEAAGGWAGYWGAPLYDAAAVYAPMWVQMAGRPPQPSFAGGRDPAAGYDYDSWDVGGSEQTSEYHGPVMLCGAHPCGPVLLPRLMAPMMAASFGRPLVAVTAAGAPAAGGRRTPAAGGRGAIDVAAALRGAGAGGGGAE